MRRPRHRDETPRIPATYWTWLAVSSVTKLALLTLSFGLVWAHTDDPRAAASILGIVVAARVVVPWIGGPVADRMGPGKVMLLCDAVMALACAGFAVFLGFAAPSLWLCLLTALLIGVIDGFYVPASAAVLKFLVSGQQMPRAMAARQLIIQLCNVFGPVCGGLAVAFAGLTASFGIAAVGFMMMWVTLFVIRGRLPMSPAASSSSSIIQSMQAGLSVVRGSKVLSTGLAATALFSALVLPIPSLMLPLMATEFQWGSKVAGVLLGGFGAGTAAITALVLVAGKLGRESLMACIAFVVCALATAGLGWASSPAFALVCAVLSGVGTGLFAAHLGPMFMKAANQEAVGRLQAVLMVAQSAPIAVAHGVLGNVTAVLGTRVVLWVWGGLALVSGLALCRRFHPEGPRRGLIPERPN